MASVSILVLYPAYGRKYSSAIAALTDWFAGKDFSSHPFGGSYTSCREWKHIHNAGFDGVRIQWALEDTASTLPFSEKDKSPETIESID